MMLIDFFDEMIELLDSGAYPGFLLDGQVAPVLDYLEIKPEMTDKVKSLISSGKLQVGPWMILPDQYPIDGESMVRNLLLGIRKSQELGGVFKVGYTSFGWGQTAQLPQIYAGFGIDVAMIGKRVNKERAPKCEFIWQGPDGSSLLSTRFGGWGRQNFYFIIHLSSLFGTHYEGPGWFYDWAKGGIAYHRADTCQMEQDHFRLDAPECWHPETITPELMEQVWKTTDESVMTDDRLMMNGCDYTACQKFFPEMVKTLNKLDEKNGRKWLSVTMPQYVELMRQKIDRSKLTVVKGELRDGPSSAMTGNALTTRLYLKAQNKYAQNLLIRFAEPLSVLANIVGAAPQDVFINRAWKYLLDSHPHDSINGVTQDKTVRDVQSSLDQVIELSETIRNRAMQEIVKRIDLRKFKDDEILLTVFNPLPYSRREVLETWVNTPMGWEEESMFGLEVPEGIQMSDADGNELGTQWEGCTEELYSVAERHTRAFPFKCKRHRLFFDTGEIPAGGYKVFRAGRSSQRSGSSQARNSMARTSTLLKAPNILENDLIRVQMNSNGTFDLTHKVLKKTWQGLNYYEDRGEIGNYWINKRPMFDKVYNSLGCNANIWSENSGPMRATLVSEITMRIPRTALIPQQARSENLAELVIRTHVSISAGSDRVDVKVEFENRHENHYLRVMFPTGLAQAKFADAGGHFTVDSRPIRPQGPSKDMVWPEMATLPQNNFVDVSDGDIGMAFLNNSLTEYEVLDNDERTVALSLLRSVYNWICTEQRCGSTFPSQKGGHCFGEHKYEYAIKPHAGNWADADIPLASELFSVPAVPVQTRAHKGELPAGQVSFFSIDNSALRFSALKKCQDRQTYVARFYNPTSKLQTGKLQFNCLIKSAWLTNLNEERASSLNVRDGHVIDFSAASYKIVTIEFETR
jgi:mannosylglycerate hydrolase